MTCDLLGFAGFRPFPLPFLHSTTAAASLLANLRLLAVRYVSADTAGEISGSARRTVCRTGRLGGARIQTCLDEFIFRFNRRRNRHAAFLSLFRQALRTKPHPCCILVKPEPSA